MEQQAKWGVIYCPKDGKGRTRRRWDKIRQHLYAQGVGFDFVQASADKSARQLAAAMTETGYGTIIAVGGDAALCEVLNGIVAAAPDPALRPALGVIPDGFGNDFARYWGLDENDYKQAVGCLRMRRTRRVDIGVVQVEGEAGTECHCFLNCVSIGVSAAIMGIRRRTRALLGADALSFLCSALWMLFQRMTFRLGFMLNGETVSCRVMNACVGSCTGYGQTPSAVPYNGLLDVTTVSQPRLAQLAYGLRLLFAGRFLKSRHVRSWRTGEAVFRVMDKAPVAIDGRRLPTDVRTLRVAVRPEAVDFIIAP